MTWGDAKKIPLLGKLKNAVRVVQIPDVTENVHRARLNPLKNPLPENPMGPH